MESGYANVYWRVRKEYCPNLKSSFYSLTNTFNISEKFSDIK